MPIISIIVPVYNVERYLERCVDSILGQIFNDYELILIDDGSRDRSGAICDRYANLDNRIKVIHKTNGGLSSARNAGLDVAQGEYVGFVDSDDWIAAEMYDELLRLLKDSGSDVAACGCVETAVFTMQAAGKNVTACFAGKAILQNYLLEGARSLPGAYSVCRNLYRRALFEGIRFPVGKLSEDISTNYKVLSRAQRMVISQKEMYFYFQGDVSISRAGLRAKHFDLFEMCQEVALLAAAETDHRIKYLVEVLNARCYFSFLARIAFYGVADSTLNREAVIQELTQELRRRYSLLVHAPIPMSRKIMITLLCVDFRLLELPLKIYKLIKKNIQ